eukprot:546741-Prorocentrum_minimum.AAC.2
MCALATCVHWQHVCTGNMCALLATYVHWQHVCTGDVYALATCVHWRHVHFTTYILFGAGRASCA